MHEDSDYQVGGVMLLGGYAQSRYVYATVEKHCKARKILATQACVVPDPCLAVSKGALLRWQGMSARGNNGDGEFGIAQEQEYDPRVHPDASKANGKVLPGTFEVGTECVFERWVPLTTMVSTLLGNSQDCKVTNTVSGRANRPRQEIHTVHLAISWRALHGPIPLHADILDKSPPQPKRSHSRWSEQRIRLAQRRGRMGSSDRHSSSKREKVLAEAGRIRPGAYLGQPWQAAVDLPILHSHGA